VFCIDELAEDGIWECGRWVEQEGKHQRTLKARADLTSKAVTDAGLAVVPDTALHPRHANIEGWPVDKTQRAAKAQLLAHAASLVKLPA